MISQVPVFALIGRSSTGKTTALKLMASIYGAPTIRDGIISDFNATQSAFFAQLNQQFGVPSLIDETSSVPEWDFSKLLYNLTTGREKLRCDNQGRLKAPLTYSGCVIFTGERSLFEQSRDNYGLHARLVEFTLPWTDSADHASRLEHGCRGNYGTAVVPLLAWLLRNRDRLPCAYQQQYAKLAGSIATADGVEDRMLKTYALIMVAAKAMKAALKLPLNIAALRTMLLEQHILKPYVQNNKAVVDTVYDQLKQQVLDNISNFPHKDDTRCARQLWGATGIRDERPCVWIADRHFKKFGAEAKRAAQASGESDNVILKALHEKHYLAKFYGDRYRKDERLGNIPTKCYCLFLHDTTFPPKKPTGKKASGSQLASLLSAAG